MTWRDSGGAAETAAAAGGFAFSIAIFWPGIALYDSVEQYRQALSGDLTDWHPPVMARLWGALARAWPGTAPMLVLQLGLYWLGLGLLAAALSRRGRGGAAWAVLLLGCGPILSFWMGAILKDGQMIGAAAAAVGIAAWFALEGRRRPVGATAAILVLLGYATVVRANAVFATVPLGLALLGWPGLRNLAWRTAAALLLIIAVLALAPAVNQRLLGARREGPENSLLLYDIAGTAIRSGSDVAGVPAARWQALAAAGCYSPVAWDALSEHGPCTIAPGLAADPDTPPLYGIWRSTVTRHALAYAAHRLAHFNATMRLAIGAGQPNGVGPLEPEPNALGLGAAPGPAQRLFWAFGGIWAALPTGWPALWLALAAAGLWASRAAAVGPERVLARALLLSATVGGLSYALVSVASDLRYHLWTILASGLGLVLLRCTGGLRRRELVVLAAVTLIVVGVGAAARQLLPPFPPA